MDQRDRFSDICADLGKLFIGGGVIVPQFSPSSTASISPSMMGVALIFSLFLFLLSMEVAK